MVSFKAIRAVVVSDFSRWKSDTRVKFIFLFTSLLLLYYLKPLISYGLEWDRSSTYNMLPILFGSTTISISTPKIMLHIGLLLLLCDAPFFYPSKQYILVRSGKLNWCIGECIYIILVAFVYIGFITVVSSLLMIPIGSFRDSWSGVVTDMHMGNKELTNAEIAVRYPHIIFPDLVIKYLYPSGAQLYTFLTAWASFSILGLLLYLVSLISKSVLWGMSIAGALVFLDPILNWLAWPRYYWLLALSPVCWTSAGQLNILQPEHFISIPFIALMSLFLLVLLCILIRVISKKVPIDGFKGGIHE